MTLYYKPCTRTLATDHLKTRLDYLEETGEFYASPKFDGEWCQLDNVFSELNTLSSRTGHTKDIPELVQTWLPPKTCLIGELSFGSQYMTQLVQKLGHNVMFVFDMLFWKGQDFRDLTQTERKQKLQGYLQELSPKYFRYVPCWEVDFWERYQKEHEGLVLKERNKSYTEAQWIKVKKRFTDEFVITSMEISNASSAKFKDFVQCIICGGWVKGVFIPDLVHVGNMPDEWRYKFKNDFMKYRGAVAEIGHWGRFKSGSVRHPSFLRIRTDKTKADCHD